MKTGLVPLKVAVVGMVSACLIGAAAYGQDVPRYPSLIPYADWPELLAARTTAIRGEGADPMTGFGGRWPSVEESPPARTGPRVDVPCSLVLVDNPEEPYVSSDPGRDAPIYHGLNLEDFVIESCGSGELTSFYDFALTNGGINHLGSTIFSLQYGFVDTVDFKSGPGAGENRFRTVNISRSRILSRAPGLSFLAAVVRNSEIINANPDADVFLDDFDLLHTSLRSSDAREFKVWRGWVFRTDLHAEGRELILVRNTLLEDSAVTLSGAGDFDLRDVLAEATDLRLDLAGDGEASDLTMIAGSLTGSVSGNAQIVDLSIDETDISGLDIAATEFSWAPDSGRGVYCNSNPPSIVVIDAAGDRHPQPIHADPIEC